MKWRFCQTGCVRQTGVFLFITRIFAADEFLGPLGLLAGLGTRIWALVIIADMTGIIFSSHTRYGFFINWFGNQQGEGFEYHLAVIALALTLLISGGGKLPADSFLIRKK
jgi:putative oxidoreductase